VREDKLPVFLEPLAEKILITGKYLNVIRECGRPVECPVELRGGDGSASSKQSGSSGRLAYTTDHRDYVDRIDKAYAFASHSLLELLMRDEQLLLRLKYASVLTCLICPITVMCYLYKCCIVCTDLRFRAHQVHQAVLPAGGGRLLRTLHGHCRIRA